MQDQTKSDSIRSGLGALVSIAALTLLGCAPAIIIGVWKWALG